MRAAWEHDAVFCLKIAVFCLHCALPSPGETSEASPKEVSLMLPLDMQQVPIASQGDAQFILKVVN